VLVIVLIGIVGVFGWYLPLIKENQSLRREIGLQKETISKLNDEIQTKKSRYQSYLYDPQSVDRLAREGLGYSREDETVFRFESGPDRGRGPDVKARQP